MNGDRLWTPWRMAYIRRAADDGESGGCIFCDLLAERDDEKNHVLARGRRTFVILNAFPYNPGHLMVAPYRHIGDFVDLELEETADCDALLKRSVEALRSASS